MSLFSRLFGTAGSATAAGDEVGPCWPLSDVGDGVQLVNQLGTRS